MRHNWITPRMGLFLVAAMLMSSLSALPPVSAAETVMTDDLLSVQGIPVEHTPEIALYGAGNTSPDEQAAYPEDIYSSTMGYDVLNDAQKSLYRKIKAAAHAFYTGTAAAEGVSYGSDEEKLPCFAIVSNTDSSLSNEDTVKVISMFRNDNPMYFFVGNNYLYSMDYDSETEENYVGAVYIACVEEYTSGTARQAERRALETQITAAREQVEAQDTAWAKARAANDWLCNSLTYAYDASGNPDDSMASHSIVGAFDERYCAAVCEGYAKAFQLLMNAAGVANAYIIGLGNGGGHAWNMAQMDDGYYYYFDVTWNDSTSSDKYFAAGETSFSKNHTPNTADGERWDYLYDLPDVPEDDGTDETGTVLTEGDFTYQLYTDHAVLTAYTGEDVFVSVPEEEKTYLEVLNRQSQRLKKLIEDLMEMSKASTGNLTADITKLDAVESVNQALGEFADKLEKAQLTPVFRHPEESVAMMADGRLAWRVLSNLLSNTVKYALPGTRVYIDVMALEGKVIISLKNISRDELNVDADELMERFVRGDDSRNTEGSGLGLNIAKTLMELQKGQLQLLVDGDLFKVTLIFPGATE